MALTDLAHRLLKAVQAGDRAAARHRVERLRGLMPKARTAELKRWLVQSKCLKVGAVAALASSVPRLPLVSAGAGALLGDLADRDSLIHLQADLVLELFALHEVNLPAPAERMAVLAIAATQMTQTSAGDALVKSIDRVSRNVLGGFLLRRALPIADIASQTATAIATTYAIGQRASAIAKLRDAELNEWPDLLRAVSGIDERQLTRFATAASKTAFEQVADSTRAWMDRLGQFVPLPDDVKSAAGNLLHVLTDPPVVKPAKPPKPTRKKSATTEPEPSRDEPPPLVPAPISRRSRRAPAVAAPPAPTPPRKRRKPAPE